MTTFFGSPVLPEDQDSKRPTFAYAATRRRYAGGLNRNRISALSHRVTRMGRALKLSNPTHLYYFSAPANWAPTTTTSLVNLCDPIVAGDDFSQRFGSHVDCTHLNLKMQASPGTTSTTVTNMRFTLFIAQQGLAFAANMVGSYNPVAGSSSIRLLKDMFYQVTTGSAIKV